MLASVDLDVRKGEFGFQLNLFMESDLFGFVGVVGYVLMALGNCRT